MGIYSKGLSRYVYVHPTFLYESILTFCIFILLFLFIKNKKKDGEIFYLYMILYGIGRAIIESFRIDSLFLYNFRISQVIALIFAVVFTGLLLKPKANKENNQ
jgi:phosphatidylglycerol:prolipoprotein diacylglycerol transferase